MSLSAQVEDTLRASQEHLRDALAFAARSEKPYVSKHIATILSDIENLLTIMPIFDKAEELLNEHES